MRLRSSRLGSLTLQLGARFVAKTADEMIVDHARGLHEGINGRRPDEAEAFGLQSLGDALWTVGVSAGTVLKEPAVDLRAAVDEVPQERREARALLQLQVGPCVVDGGLDLQPVAHDAWVGHQPRNILGAIAGDALGVELVEGVAEVLALPEDGEPRQAGLEAFQHQLLEHGAVVGLRHAPLLVVIARVEGIGDAGPGAAYGLCVSSLLRGRTRRFESRRAPTAGLRCDRDAAGCNGSPLALHLGRAVETDERQRMVAVDRAERADGRRRRR